jgi:hypothetical protein
MFRISSPTLAAAARSLLVTLGLVGFLAGTLGVPIPAVRISGKDRSEPFPCMDRQCGCRTAAQCWKGCCCFTNREKLAWARRQGVEPPEDVVLAAQQEETELASAAACCSTKRENVPPVCEETPDDCCDVPELQPSSRTDFVLLTQVRQCLGQAEWWLAAGAAVPLPAATEVDVPLEFCGTLCMRSVRLATLFPTPATPPPKA